MRLHVRSVAACLVSGALLLGACGDGDDDGATGTTAPAGAGTVTTTSGTTGTSTSTAAEEPTATTGGAAACPGAPLPEGATDTATVTADLDGDGTGDTVTSYRLGPAGSPDWHLHARLGSGGGADLALAGPTGAGGARALGASDLDGDGAEELWARVGAGAAAQIVGLFLLEGCDLVGATVDGGGPAEFPVGGSIGTVSGVDCADEDGDGEPDLVVTSAERAGGEGYEARIEVYRLVGTDLRFRFGDTGSVDAGSPSFDRFTRLDCGDATL